jgi:hypothetical protein
MNPVSDAIVHGKAEWRKSGGLARALKSGDLTVPKVWFPGQNKGKRVLLLTSGLHLEETSGPILLLDPKLVLPTIYPFIQKGVNVLIYPAINQYGLSFDPAGDDKLLRYNQDGINYNDGWGFPNDKKCKEVALVEEDILQTKKNYEFIFALSLHEDSETPKKGYIYTNGISDPNFRKKLRQGILSEVPPDILATQKELDEGIQPEFEGGVVEEGFCLVEAKDPGSLENWLADDLHIPTVLSESPFGLDLETRKSFHLSVIKSVITSLTSNRSG